MQIYLNEETSKKKLARSLHEFVHSISHLVFIEPLPIVALLWSLCCHGHGLMVVGFSTTCAISACHH